MDSIQPDASAEPGARVASARALLSALAQLARHEQKNYRPIFHDPLMRARLAAAEIELVIQEQMVATRAAPLTALALAAANQAIHEDLVRLRMAIARSDALVLAPDLDDLDDLGLANIIAQAPAIVEGSSAPLYSVFVGRSLLTATQREAFARALLDSVGPARAARTRGASAAAALYLLERGGNAVQHAALAERIRNGMCQPAIATLERGAGYDFENVRTRLQHSDGQAHLHGRKSVVMDGDVADILFVSARVNETMSVDGPDDDGRSLYCIEAQRPGVSRHLLKGMDGLTYAEIAFDRVVVAERDRIGPCGDAVPLLISAIDTGRIELCREALGLMEQLAAEFATQALHSRSDAGLMVGYVAVELEKARAALRVGQVGLHSGNMLARCRAVSAAKHIVGKAGRFIAEQAARAALPGAQAPFARLQAIDLIWGDADHHRDRYAALMSL